MHRIAAAVVGVIVADHGLDRLAPGRVMVAGARSAPSPTLLALTGTAAALYAVQVIVGALQIWTTLAPWAVALHLALGAAIWALLVAAVTYSYCEARTAVERRRRDARAPETPTAMAGSTTTPVAPTRRAAHPASTATDKVRAYVALTKPRIIELLLVTTVPAMVLAQRGIPPLGLIAATLVGGSLAAGSANAINQYLDRDIDQLMTRTRRRPLPAHAIEPEDALVFGLALGVVAFAELAVFTNLLAAFLTLLAIAFYVVVYTIWMKRTTPQNIVIGGLAGALPPLIGWAAVTGDIALPGLFLVAIVFYWTPPHFWALSMRLAKDYRAAGVPMLPVVRGIPETTKQIALYSVLDGRPDADPLRRRPAGPHLPRRHGRHRGRLPDPGAAHVARRHGCPRGAPLQVLDDLPDRALRAHRRRRPGAAAGLRDQPPSLARAMRARSRSSFSSWRRPFSSSARNQARVRKQERHQEDQVAGGPHDAARQLLVLERRRAPDALHRGVVLIEHDRSRRRGPGPGSC